MSLKLRDLIRQVRACKTAAEERGVIAKESAMIRTAIREEKVHFRHRNVAKLLFMHMLGYPTHFGQLECMKLIASPHFPEKRIGYLGMMLLLSQEADVLMLATNALKNDLNSDNKFVSGLALCAIGNLATADMSRDLAPEVDKHLKSAEPYLRKKASLAMARCLTKCPDMVEDFVDRVVTLLKDRSHGVLITVVQLMTQVLVMDQKNMELEGGSMDEDDKTPCQVAFAKLVPSLVKLLRNIIGGGYSAEYDVGSGSDPFLQVQLLTLLRLLGTGNEKASEEMNDVLAQVATNTETSKNSGNAILYECVMTIMAIESEDGLRVLAVNILGRFLLNRDNNIRYVALNTLSKCIQDEKNSKRGGLLDATPTEQDESANSASTALQRHRATIVDCLKDPDVSIRQRALELIYHLVNAQNVQDLCSELLGYLVLCPREHRADICTRILRVCEAYSPNDRWRVETLITMLTIAGRECDRNVQSSSIIYISRSDEDIRAYATHKLLKAIRDDDGTQFGLSIVGIWCIGEYGDLLLKPYTYTPDSTADVSDLTGSDVVSISFMALDPSSVVSTIEEVITRPTCPEEVKHHSLTSFVKLSERYANSGDAATLDKLHQLLKKNSNSHKLELQLRSCEYDALVNAMKGISASTAPKDNNDIFGMAEATAPTDNSAVVAAAKEALARMPVIDLEVLQRKRETEVNGDDDDFINIKTAEKEEKPAGGGDLLDLNDIFGANGTTAEPVAETKTTNGTSNGATKSDKSDVDLLSDIFSAPAPTVAAPAPSVSGGYDPFNGMANNTSQPPAQPLDMLSSLPTGAPPAPPAAAPAAPALDVLGDAFAPAAPTTNGTTADGPVVVPGPSHQGLTIEFECTKPEVWNKQQSNILAKFTNTTDTAIYGLSMQCAVPKYVTMEMKPPTSTTIPVSAGNSSKQVTQLITVTNSKLGEKNLMLKLKLGFTLKGNKVDHMATCSGFPAGKF